MSSPIGKFFKFIVVATGTVAAGYGIKKAYDNNFQDFKDFANKGKNLLCETFRPEKNDDEYEETIEIIEEDDISEFID